MKVPEMTEEQAEAWRIFQLKRFEKMDQRIRERKQQKSTENLKNISSKTEQNNSQKNKK